ncbi:MAG: outer membrane protein assembly factor BamE [Pirellula sp.]|jgi:hypothetical protein
MKKKLDSKRILIAIVLISISLVFVAVPLALRMLEPPGGLARLRQLKVGMQRSQVLEILGTPNKEDVLTWLYESRIGWTWVGFDTNNELVFVDAEGAMGGWSLVNGR